MSTIRELQHSPLTHRISSTRLQYFQRGPNLSRSEETEKTDRMLNGLKPIEHQAIVYSWKDRLGAWTVREGIRRFANRNPKSFANSSWPGMQRRFSSSY
jgi:hypothetical protein